MNFCQSFFSPSTSIISIPNKKVTKKKKIKKKHNLSKTTKRKKKKRKKRDRWDQPKSHFLCLFEVHSPSFHPTSPSLHQIAITNKSLFTSTFDLFHFKKRNKKQQQYGVSLCVLPSPREAVSSNQFYLVCFVSFSCLACLHVCIVLLSAHPS